jgi:excisionase family DNA binding protein
MRKELRKTPTEAAAYWGVSRMTVYRWMRKNKLLTERTPSGRQLIIIHPPARRSKKVTTEASHE